MSIIEAVPYKPKFEATTKFVSPDFVEELRNLPVPNNAISEFTFYRTYSRYLEHKGRRETWLEAAIRAGEYSVELAIRQLKKEDLWKDEMFPIFVKEAESLIRRMYSLEVFVSGRTLYTGGSKAAEMYPLSNFNCSSAVIDSFEKFGEMFYLLMVGTGFGFRILREDVSKLPMVRNDIKISHKEYDPRPKNERYEHTKLWILDDGERIGLEIGDSKEGWREAIDLYFEIHTSDAYMDVKSIVIIYDSVRPKGERLKNFGGTASGPESMENMFKTIGKVIDGTLDERIAPPAQTSNYVRLRPIHAMDIANAIAYNVVSGGVRRSAQICLFDHDEYEVLFAKYGLNGLYGQASKDNYDYLRSLGHPVPEIVWGETTDFQTGKLIPFASDRIHLAHRRMSNNSVVYYKKPSRELLHLIVSLLKAEGEPGFFNMEEALRRFPYAKGTNPCVEILLDDRGLCNLSTIPVINHVRNGVLDKESLFDAARISARIGVRMTTIDLELPEWDAKQKEHRLTGCSLTGWQDMLDAVGMGPDEETALLRELRQVTKDEGYRYADFLGVPRPANVTAIKPEGTQSLLAGGVSSGLHKAHAPYYMRRIRVSATDALVKTAELLEWPIENEVGQGVTYQNENGEIITTPVSTKVLAFPLSSPSSLTKDDITVDDQFDTYFRFQKHYTDQNTSNTITVKPHEWTRVEEVLWDRWDEMLAVSFLSHDGGTYQLAPLEAITKEQYEEALATMKPFNPEILELFETKEEFDLDDAAACEGGACPIR